MIEGGDLKDKADRALWSRALTPPERRADRTPDRETRAAPDRQTRKSSRQGGRK